MRGADGVHRGFAYWGEPSVVLRDDDWVSGHEYEVTAMSAGAMQAAVDIRENLGAEDAISLAGAVIGIGIVSMLTLSDVVLPNPASGYFHYDATIGAGLWLTVGGSIAACLACVLGWLREYGP